MTHEQKLYQALTHFTANPTFHNIKLLTMAAENFQTNWIEKVVDERLSNDDS